MNVIGVFVLLISCIVGIAYYIGDINYSYSSHRTIERSEIFFPSAQAQEVEGIPEFEVNKDVSLSIENVNGPIKITGSPDATARIIITKRGPDKEIFEKIKVKRTLNKNHISLKTVYPDHSIYRISIGYEIIVPHGSHIEKVKTINGKLVIKHINGRINAQTVNGSIAVSDIHNAVHASSVNGRIIATVSDLPNNKKIQLKTTNGSIDCSIKRSLSANVHAKTTVGTVRSDFNLKTLSDQFVGKEVEGIIGDDDNPSASIDLVTTSGRITLRSQ